MAVDYITVTGTYLLPDGVTPNFGYVEFRPNVTLTATDLGVILPDTLQAVLDKNGHFEIELLTTDNPLVAPVGWVWLVDEKIKNGNRWYLQTKSLVNGGRDPLDITIAYGAGIESPPSVIEVPAPTPIVDKGSLILDGTAFPGVNTGAQDDYYLDTDDHILYGPKGLGHSGTLLTGASTDNALSTTHSYGLRFKALSGGYITALRFYRDNTLGGAVTARTLTLWSDAGAVLATAATVGETNGWLTVNLNTPYPITVGNYYRVSYNVEGNNTYAYRTVTPVSVNPNFTDLAAYQSAALNTFPNTVIPNRDFLADIEFQLNLDYWPVAIKSVPVGGNTSQVLSKASGTDYDVAWVDSSAGGGGGGVTDHGALTGLSDDDHPQYLTNARGDARYAPVGSGGGGTTVITGAVESPWLTGAVPVSNTTKTANLAKWITARQQMASRLVRVACIGNSNTYGWAEGEPNSHLYAYPFQVASLLNPTAFGRADVANMKSSYNSGAETWNIWKRPYINISGAWTWAGGGIANDGYLECGSGELGTLTYQNSDCEVLILAHRDNATFTYKVDSGSNVTVTATNSNTVKEVVITCPSRGNHTLTINPPISGTLGITYLGASTAKGVLVANFGVPATSTGDWLVGGNTAYSSLNSSLKPFNPDLVIYQLPNGSDETESPPLTAAQVQANIEATIDWVRAYTSADIIIQNRYYGSDQAYFDAITNACISRNTPVFHIDEMLGDYTQWESGTGQFHLTSKAHTRWSAALQDALTAEYQWEPVDRVAIDSGGGGGTPSTVPEWPAAKSALATDLNTIKSVGFYETGNTAANAPVAEYGYLITTRERSGTTTDGDYCGQIWLSQDPPARMYIRNSSLNVWSAWVQVTGGGGGITQTDADTRYVNVTGDAMTGPLAVQGAASTTRSITLSTGTSPRWRIAVDSTAEGGSNNGSFFEIDRYSDAGTLIGSIFYATRATGIVTFTQPVYLNDPVPTAANHAASKQYVDARVPKITVASTAPSSPATGDVWIDTT